MELDTTPATVLVSSVTIRGQKATLHVTDEDAVQWTVTLPLGFGNGAAYWFASTIETYVKTMRSAYRLTSIYDEARDEWFTTAGNYGIKSRDLQFVEGWAL